MYQRDKIKSIIGVILIAIIILTHVFFGKETAKPVAVAGIVIWILTMAFFAKKKN